VVFDQNTDRIFLAMSHLRWGLDGGLVVRDLKTGVDVLSDAFEPAILARGANPRSPGLAVNRDGTRVAVGCRTGLRVYDTQSRELCFQVPYAVAAVFTPDGKEFLALDSLANRVTVRDPVDGKERRSLAVAFSPYATSRAFSPSGRSLAWGLGDGDIEVAPLTGEAADVRRYRIGHVGEVSAITFDEEERRIATGGADGTVRIWDLEATRPGPVFRGHSDRVTAVAFDPAGTKLASVGWGPEAKIWDLTRQYESARVGGNPRPGVRRVEDCMFAPDGRSLLIIRVPAGELETWDPATGRRKSERKLDLAPTEDGLPIPGRTAAFSAEGRWLAAVSGVDPRIVKVWNTATEQPPIVLKGLSSEALYIGISADGSRVAAAAALPEAMDVIAWDARSGNVVRRFSLPGEKCTALTLTSDGARLVAASRSAGSAIQVRIWSLDDGRQLHSLPCGDEVNSVTFDGPGNLLAAVTEEPKLLIWDAKEGKSLHTIQCLDTYVHLAFAPDGKRLAGATREMMTLWDPVDGDEVLTLRGLPRSGSDPPFNPRITFDRTGRQLAVNQADNTVTIWTAAGYPGVK
jgi:WD40 repeat protein